METTRMILFFIGVIEMVIISTWTRAVTETKVLVSGVVTVINVLIWYYVLSTIVNNISNVYLVLLYAAGCSIGTMLTTGFYSLRERHTNKIAKANS